MERSEVKKRYLELNKKVSGWDKMFTAYDGQALSHNSPTKFNKLRRDKFKETGSTLGIGMLNQNKRGHRRRKTPKKARSPI